MDSAHLSSSEAPKTNQKQSLLSKIQFGKDCQSITKYLLPGRKNVCSAAKEQWTRRVTCGNPLPGLPSPHALVVILVLQEYRFPSWSPLSLQESHPHEAEQGVPLELHKAQSQTRVKGNSSEFHLNPIKSTAGSS